MSEQAKTTSNSRSAGGERAELEREYGQDHPWPQFDGWHSEFHEYGHIAWPCTQPLRCFWRWTRKTGVSLNQNGILPLVAQPAMSEQEKLREALLNKLPRLMRQGEQWVRLRDVEALLSETPPAKVKEYKHWLWCNGDRRVPAGEPGHSCCCFNAKTQEMLAAPPAGLNMDFETWFASTGIIGNGPLRPVAMAAWNAALAAAKPADAIRKEGWREGWDTAKALYEQREATLRKSVLEEVLPCSDKVQNQTCRERGLSMMACPNCRAVLKALNATPAPAGAVPSRQVCGLRIVATGTYCFHEKGHEGDCSDAIPAGAAKGGSE